MSISASPSLSVLLFADDLTGACDAGVAFASRGLRTEVSLDSFDGNAQDATVHALTTETRDVLPAEAKARLKKLIALDEVVRAQHLFKKIDSVFRGNTYLEVALCAHEFPCDIVVIAPSAPKMGRTSVSGVIAVRDIAGNRTVPVLDGLIAEGMSPYLVQHGLSAPKIADTMRAQSSGGRASFYCDAVSEGDLRAVVEAARSLGRRTLWIGAAGLAHALAEELHPLTKPPLSRLPLLKGKVLFFIGSDHVVTQKQSRALQNLMAIEVDDPRYALVMHRVELRHEVIQLKHGHSPEADVSHAVELLKPGTVGCLVMTGGDTAMLVCRTLGIHSLRLHDEFAPGLPRATAQGGIFDGVTVILKSGGFGNEDVLCRIAHAFSPQHEVMQ